MERYRVALELLYLRGCFRRVFHLRSGKREKVKSEILKLLKKRKKEMRHKDLRKKFVPNVTTEQTFSRCLRDLESDGEIRRRVDKERNVWYSYIGKKKIESEPAVKYLEFRNHWEYLVKLRHSENLLQEFKREAERVYTRGKDSIRKLLKDEEQARIFLKITPNIGSNLEDPVLSEKVKFYIAAERALCSKFFIQHIESGYPEVNKLLIEERELGSKNSEYHRKFSEAIGQIVRERGFELEYRAKEKRWLDPLLIEPIITQYYSPSIGNKPKSRIEVKADGANVRVSYYDYIVRVHRETFLGGNGNSVNDVEKLLDDCINSKKLKNLYSSYSQSSKEYKIKRSKLMSEILLILLKLRDGVPFRGECIRCK